MTTDASRVGTAAQQQGLTVAAAESLTGGAVSSALAAAPDAARWYRGAVVAYAAEVKFGVLGVTPGPVATEECAAQLAEGVARLLGADAAVATTGVGGPGPEEGKPAGSVFLGNWVRGRTRTVALHLGGTPEQVVQAATEAAIGLLAEQLGEG